MDITLTHLTNGTPTTKPNTANQITVRANGRPVMTLARATHPMYRVQGYTLTPHPKDPNARTPHHYDPDAFADGHLDQRLQNRMWIDPAMAQPDDVRRDPDDWGTLDDLIAALRPLLKN